MTEHSEKPHSLDHHLDDHWADPEVNPEAALIPPHQSEEELEE